MTNSTPKLRAILEDWRRYDVIEDRLEYCVEDFESGHNLTREEAETLYQLLREYNPESDRRLQGIVDDLQEMGSLQTTAEDETIDDLREEYELTDQEAYDLYHLIQYTAGIDLPKVHPESIPSWVHKEYFIETREGDFEGYTESEIVTLNKWFADMRRYWAAVKDDPDRDPVTGRVANSTYGSTPGINE